MSYQSPVDICNRAAQHCGVQRIVSFTDDTLQASEFAFAYDKLRRAELRRNVWQFATRKACLRAVTTGTMFLNPVLWSSTITYGYGAIVSDVSGFLWASRAQDNLNNTPSSSSAWEAYCGPLSVQPYDTTGTTGYFTGELVYETPGDGTYSVYLSLMSGNSQDPRAPSQWIINNTYSKDNVVINYAAWVIGTTYAAGNTINYNGIVYTSLVSSNTGNEPDTSPASWSAVPSAVAPPYYNSTTSYAQGNWITYLGINYVSLVNANLANTPSTSPSDWLPQAAPTFYVSLIDFNMNNNPSSAPALWASGTTYATGNSVGGSNGLIYTSVGNGNIGHDPTLDITGTYWTNTNVLNPWTTLDNFGKANAQWLQLNVGLTDQIIIYPLGAGPAYQSYSKNIYRLPANFLRKAPQDPKAGSTSFLGAPTGLMYNDWNMDGSYIVTREVYPIVLRFVADVTDVSKFDDMFCELLAARIALETVERLTQSTAKLGAISAMYKQFGTEARLVNGIETGSEESPEDEYVTCRI